MGVERIAVLGAGNAGCGIAADLALKGHEVRLFEIPQLAESFAAIRASREIVIKGVARQGRARLAVATHDVAEAIEGVDLIVVAVPSFGVAPMTEVVAPHLQDGDSMVFLPGAFASVVSARVLQRLGVTARVTLGDVCTLPYGCRLSGPNEVTVFINATRLPAAALPASETGRLVELLRELYPVVEPAADVLDVALKNINPCIHPGPSILNTGRIEFADDFYLYAEGMTPGTRRVMVAVDQERQRVREAWGYPAPHYGLDPTPGVYEVFEHYFGYGGLDSAGKKMRGPLEMRDRYVTEDIPYGLAFYASMGDLVGVETPVCDSLVTLGGTINDEDYWQAGLTAAALGLEGATAEDVKSLLQHGLRPEATPAAL